MNRSIVLCAVVTMFACGGPAVVPTAPKPTPTTAATVAPVVETDDARARAFIAKLAAHDFDGAVASFDEKMHAAMPKEKLADIWSKIEAGAGALKTVDAIDMTTSGDVRIAAAKTTFEHAPMILRVGFDSQNRVTAFFISVGDLSASWQPPTYADTSLFDDTRVTIGTAPKLPGTLSIPKNAKHFPLVVLVHGSGPNDEDETIGALKVFKDLAFGLASRGVAVIRYEKRTHIDPTGVATQKEEVDDAAHQAIAFARTVPDVDVNRIALLGHSQGGNLAPRIAQADPAIKRLVILAGNTRSLQDAIIAQFTYLDTLQPNQPKLQSALLEAKQFKKTVEAAQLKATDMVKLPFGSSIGGAYFLEVRNYHAERVAASLKIPMLLLQGEGDYQVTVKDDFGPWKTALAHHANATLKTYPNLSHAFTQAGTPPSPADYEKPAHVDEQVVKDIAQFLNAP